MEKIHSNWGAKNMEYPRAPFWVLYCSYYISSDLSLGIKMDLKLTLNAYDTGVLIFGNNIHEILAKSRILY
jgi:hypothetical protein